MNQQKRLLRFAQVRAKSAAGGFSRTGCLVTEALRRSRDDAEMVEPGEETGAARDDEDNVAESRTRRNLFCLM